MTLSMFQASIPVFVRTLTNLKGILDKAVAHAQARKIDESVLLAARLYPDMFPLTRQVQIATDFARGTGARLAGVEPPSIEDTERTFAELADRIDRTLAYLRTLTPAQVDGSEAREIIRAIRGVPHTFAGIDYLLKYALPNFYFHTTTAYAILRHSGIEIGKTDFVGRFD
ncbi:MAG: DUF1993 domain-containing protein [Betaproteobacteria bacterium]